VTGVLQWYRNFTAGRREVTERLFGAQSCSNENTSAEVRKVFFLRDSVKRAGCAVCANKERLAVVQHSSRTTPAVNQINTLQARIDFFRVRSSY